MSFPRPWYDLATARQLWAEAARLHFDDAGEDLVLALGDHMIPAEGLFQRRHSWHDRYPSNDRGWVDESQVLRRVPDGAWRHEVDWERSLVGPWWEPTPGDAGRYGEGYWRRAISVRIRARTVDALVLALSAERSNTPGRTDAAVSLILKWHADGESCPGVRPGWRKLHAAGVDVALSTVKDLLSAACAAWTLEHQPFVSTMRAVRAGNPVR